MKKQNLLLTLVLLIATMFSAMSQTAVQPSGSGAVDDPYLIESLDNLYWVTQNSSSWRSYFVQTTDIDASATSTWDFDGSGGYYGFLPIGTGSNTFQGVYDGQGHTIDNLYINRETTYEIGMFGCTYRAKIRQLNLRNVDITGYSMVGGLCGYAVRLSVDSCSVNGKIYSKNKTCGGIIGYSSGSSKVFCSYTDIDIHSDSYEIGGIIGRSNTYDTIAISYSVGSCSATSSIGGLVGYLNKSTIVDCYSAVVCTGNYKGGLVGSASSYSSVINSFWDKDVATVSYSAIGGEAKTTAEMKDIKTFTKEETSGLSEAWDYIGNSNDDNGTKDYWALGPSNDGYLVLSWQDSVYSYVSTKSLSNVTSTSVAVNCNIVHIGTSNQESYGVCWSTSENPTVSNSKTDEGVAVSEGDYTSNITGLTEGTQYYIRSYITDGFGTQYGEEFSFVSGGGIVIIDSITNMIENQVTAYGDLQELGSSQVTSYGFCWNTSGNPTLSDSFVDKGATSTTGEFYADLTGLKGGVKYYVRPFVTNDKGTNYGQVKTFIIKVKPAGSGIEDDPYQIASLANLYWLTLADTAWDKYYVQTANIDASVTHMWNINGTDTLGFSPIGNSITPFKGMYDGQGYTISNLYINRENSNKIGMFGSVYKALGIKHLNLVNVDISGKSYVGGIVGYNGENTIDSCSVTGKITGDTRLGGISGYVSNCFIGESYSNVFISGIGSECGGLTGLIDKVTVKNSYSIGSCTGNYGVGGLVGSANDFTVSNCYSAVKVLATGSNPSQGGLIGIYGSSSSNIIENSFWDTEVSGLSTSNGGTGKTTAEMKDIATFTNITTSGLVDAWDYISTYNNDTAHNDYWAMGPGNDGYLVLSWQDSVYSYVDINKISNITATSATVIGDVVYLKSGNNQINHGFCWNTSGSPTIADSKADLGVATDLGEYSYDITGLTDGTKYYVRAYIEDNMGVNYSLEKTFVAGAGYSSTDSVIIVSDNLVTFYANLLSLGSSAVTNYGFCYNRTGSPTIDDSVIDKGATSTTGVFSADISGLVISYTYYVRSFVTNGSGTSYGDEVKFTVTAKPAGSGTENDPYQIASLCNLHWVSTNSTSWSGYFIQTADINASSTRLWNIEGSDTLGFSPIGINSTTKFAGIYDGQGHIIDSLYINRPTENNCALIGYIKSSNSKVKNIGVTNANIRASENVGALIGTLYYGECDNCFSTGEIICEYSSVGGLIGTANAYIHNSYSMANVTKTAYNSSGGLVGSVIGGTIENCYSTGDITGNASVGGFIGYVREVTVKNSYSTGKVTASSSMGGFIGADYDSSLSSIENCFWDTETSGQSTSTGGTGKTTVEMKTIYTYTNTESNGLDESWDFIYNNNNGTWLIRGGLNNGYPALAWQQDSLYAICEYETVTGMTSSTVTIEGNVIYLNTSTPTAYGICWNTTGEPTTSDNKVDKGVPSATGKFTAQMTGLLNTETYYVRTFITNKFGTYYGKEVEVSIDKPFVVTDSIVNASDLVFTGYGNIINIGSTSITHHGFCWNTSGNPTVNDNKTDEGAISSVGTFSTTITLPAGFDYYIKSYAINSDDTVYSEEVSVTTIIKPEGEGIESNPYRIAHLGNLRWVSEHDTVWDKYFIQTADINAAATHLWNINEADTLGFSPIGNGTISFSGNYDGQGHTIDSLYINRPNTNYIGLFGKKDRMLNRVFNLGLQDADITGGSFVGGLVGYELSGIIENSFVTGHIISKGWYCGGITGLLSTGIISNCYNRADIITSQYAGGITSKNSGTIKNSYSTGFVNCSTYAGGLVGENGGIVKNSFWDTETSDQSTSAGGVGKTTTEMTLSCTFTDDGWDFMSEYINGIEDIWGMSSTENGSYPFLKWQGYTNDKTCGPSVQVSGLSVTIGTSSTDISWTNGNGSGRVVFVKEGYNGYPEITDKTTYNADSQYGNGDVVSTDWYCVYNGTGNSVTVTGLTPGYPYRIMVFEYNNNTDIRYSTDTVTNNINNFVQNKLVQTITFNTFSPVTYGDADFSPGATINSSLDIIYSSSDEDVATIVNGKIHIVSAGSCIIYTDQPGDTSHYAAAQVSQTLTVNKKELTVTGITVEDKVYDGTTDATISGTLSGVVSGDDVTILLSASFIDKNIGNGKQVTSTSSLSGADVSNYTLLQPTGLIADITAKELTITGIAVEDKVYDGTTDVSISGASLMGIVTGDYVSLSLESATFDSSDAGSNIVVTAEYSISGTDAVNYKLIQPTGLSANITKTQLIVTADDKQKTYGEDNPEFTFTYSGFVNDEDEIVLDVKPVITCSATTVSDAGSYDIIVSGGSDNNYDFTYENAILTIIKADQTITVTEIPNKDLATDALTFDVEATTTSGLDLTYEIVSGPASISGNTITLTEETGTVILKVSQEGTINYNPASVTLSFKVIDSRKQDQTITFESISDKKYGDVFDLNVSASSGLEVSLEVLSGSATISGKTVTIIGIGDVTIKATQEGDDSYNPADAVEQSFTVTKANLTVSVKDTSRLVGEENPEFVLVFDGLVNGDDESVIDELPVVSCEADVNSSVGVYDIVLSGGSDDNYNLILVNGELTVKDSNVGISDNNIVNISIYPNPAQSVLTIDNNSLTVDNIEVLNAMGEVVIFPEFDYGTQLQTVSINVSQLQQGIYFVKVTSGDEVRVIRFFKK